MIAIVAKPAYLLDSSSLRPIMLVKNLGHVCYVIFQTRGKTMMYVSPNELLETQHAVFLSTALHFTLEVVILKKRSLL